jgi:polyphosphate kinase
VDRQYACWRNELRPAWPGNGIRFLRFGTVQNRPGLGGEFYRAQVRPVLTPLGLDPAHPFPQLLNKSLNTIVQLEITEAGQRASAWPWCRCRACCPGWCKLPRADSRQQHYIFWAT